MFRFQLPDIGEGIVEAEVIEWKVAEGDPVSLDQILVEVMTDKANIEIPSPRAGRVHRLAFAEGDIVPVGAVLIEIDDEEVAGDAAAAPVSEGAPAGGEAPREAPPPPAVSPPPSKPPAPAPASRVSPPPPRAAPSASDATAQPPAMPPRPRSSQLATASGGEQGVHAVPAVRDLARRLGIDLTQCTGSGPGGRIMRRDVEELAAEQARRAGAEAAPAASPPSAAVPAVSPAPAAPDPEDWERVPLRGVRRAIASHMARSRRTAAHFSYVEEVDLTRLLEERDRVPELRDLSPLVFIARAAVEVLPEHPLLNASLDEERGDLIFKRLIHLGIAVAAEEGLMVPVIENAASLSMLELAREIEALAEGAREGRLGPSQLRGSTFTITSLGKLGGVASTPILNYPESAILGVNALRRLPRYVEGALAPRDVLNLSMSVDHRIADGLHCARFTQDVKRWLEQPSFPEFDGS